VRGDQLADALRDLGIGHDAFAEKIGRDLPYLNFMIEGNTPVPEYIKLVISLMERDGDRALKERIKLYLHYARDPDLKKPGEFVDREVHAKEIATVFQVSEHRVDALLEDLHRLDEIV